MISLRSLRGLAPSHIWFKKFAERGKSCQQFWRRISGRGSFFMPFISESRAPSRSILASSSH